MTIASYSDLKAMVARRLKRTDLTSYIPDYIALGEARIYRELRVRQMETAFSSVMSSGLVSLPSGYQELKYAYISGSPTTKLERKDAETINSKYPTRSASGLPKWIGRDAQSFIFGPFPDSDYTVIGTYYKRLDALSDSNTSNWLITDAFDLILAASMVEGWDDLQNAEQMARWEGKYGMAKAQIERQDREEEFSGSPLSSTPR